MACALNPGGAWRWGFRRCAFFLALLAVFAASCRNTTAPETPPAPLDLTVTVERLASGGVAIVAIAIVTGQDPVSLGCLGSPIIVIRDPNGLAFNSGPDVCVTPVPNRGVAPGTRISSRVEFLGFVLDEHRQPVPAPAGVYTALATVTVTLPNRYPLVFLGSVEKAVSFTWP